MERRQEAEAALKAANDQMSKAAAKLTWHPASGILLKAWTEAKVALHRAEKRLAWVVREENQDGQRGG